MAQFDSGRSRKNLILDVKGEKNVPLVVIIFYLKYFELHVLINFYHIL